MKEEPHTPKNYLCTTNLHFDYAHYASHLKGGDLSETQAREFLQTLYSIMIQFVDLGFNVPDMSVPSMSRRCGEDQSGLHGTPADASSVLLSEDILSVLGPISTDQHSDKEAR